MILYLLKSGILLLVFYTVYKLWLESEKMFRFNRAYLLGSLVFSVVVPLQLFSLKPLFKNGLNTIQLEGIVIKTSNVVLNKSDITQTIFSILILLYIIVALLLIARFTLNLYSFYRKLKSNEAQFVNGDKVILIEESILPHPFWNAIFINKNEFELGKIPSELIIHEKAHIEQKHTLDVLFVELLQIVFWFNPFILLYKKAIKLNHEFLADEAVNKQFTSVADYQNLLLDFASNKTTIALASNINYLITKKRLLMMTKKESPIKIVLKVCTVSVVFVLLLFVFSAESIAQKANTVKMQNGFAVSYDTTSVKKPEFPGGIAQFYMFIGQRFKIPTEASKNKLEGKLSMEFMVEKDGSLSEIKVLKDLGYGLGDEAVRVLKLSPKWNPASEKGQPVRVKYSLPITIQTEK
jgi:beta-lactamase regulating signal transducer with metallopeptidase domain